jgi:hypothetical protein
MSLLIDRELIADRLYGAFNLIYDPATTRIRATRLSERDANLGFGAALMTRVAGTNLFLGAEARYLRHYDSMSLDQFAGQALYVGPTFYYKLSDKWSLAGAWNMQVSGRAEGEPGALDLVNFERHRVKLRISAELE